MAKLIVNSLNMKPNQIRTMFSDRFSTATDLKLAIEKAVLISGQDADYINVRFGPEETGIDNSRLDLQAECLSDGSIVHNITLMP